MTSNGSQAGLLALLQEFTLETDRYVERVSRLHGLHRTAMNALAFLVRSSFSEKSVTAGRLSEALNISTPATTALLDRLDKAGHVTRQRSTDDRRQVELAMTDHAREVGRSLFSPLAAHIGAALERYSPEEQDLARRFLTDMIAATVEAREDIPAPAGSSDSSAPPEPPAPSVSSK